ncbi:Tail attachment protein (Minor capsid protein FII) [Escherichia coli]|uniref:Tail attachment protein (Minor capsid protein FII) n=1 Tax=Escherichia coli TaxID=562 RepID=A0A2X3M025_ECOLX|nr:Tail attachment protein (Minor capsid protein FII) [Escherichia coli]
MWRRSSGVFDDPESLGFAGSGVRIEGSSPSLFVRTDTVRAVRRGDTLTINGEIFWVDRVSPDDGGSCYLWLNRGQPPALTGDDKRRVKFMAIKGLEQAIDNLRPGS